MNSFPLNSTIRLYQLAIVSALCALAAGCRSDPNIASHIEMMNIERRTLEDQLYELEYDYERKVAELEEAKERLRRFDGGDSDLRHTDETPRIELPEADDDMLDLSPPSVTPGVPDQRPLELPEPGASGRSNRRDFETQPVRIGPTLLEPDDPRITHIHIDPVHTGGSDFDQQPGDDGILVVVEPRNRNEAFVPLAGPVSVVVLDYAKREAGDEARIARWELTAQQIDRSLHNNSTQRGIYLRLPWGDERPESSKLMVAVRYTTADGRKLEATRDIFVTRPGQFSQRWTRRSTDETDDGEERGSINVARQPSATDEARAIPTPPRREPIAGRITSASHESSESAPSGSLPLPTWRPYR
ncbi:MAG: hypothetical protein H8E66_24105 [Planctomycetes bacterium]|nr:hypothetical protein [Planctomycetota bacterium]